ncbi:MAG TPA: preprotein translocase subunit SecY [Opitutae bacterium]|mgnify:CR=1 FL=1|nr:preprotein translocase subunit SecY [Opitutae bacterium]|tara:strand:+ start:4200 stop:5702 length:1503 start_codon:yes stop_codon:yes gene_type:complete
MLSAFTNSFKIPELRQRIFFTLGLLFVARVGANVPLPGVDPTRLQAFFQDQIASSGGSLVGLYNMFTGGALLKGAIFGLGIMPYISASIIFQLLTPVVPSLARMQQEGESGRQKLTQYTRYATLIVCLIQSVLLLLALMKNPGSLVMGYDVNHYGPIVIATHGWFLVSSTIILTAGTMLLMWLGEQITQRGIGNGVSLLITVGILADLPRAISQAIQLFSRPVGAQGPSLGLPQGILMLVLFLAVVASIVAVTQATRKIPVQYAKRVVGRKVYGGQSSFLPLKVNYSGVMPIIFASAILIFPQQIFAYLGAASGMRFFQDISLYLTPGTATYYTLYALLILAFSYFWVSIMFKPIQIADDLKKHGGYIPGVRPGEPTAKFLDFVMTRLTLAGAIFLVIIALFPNFLNTAYNVPYSIALFFGGTGTLIAVGVVLDTMKQVETFLLQRHYDGFLKKGRIRGRNTARSSQVIDAEELKGLATLWIPLGILFIVGIVAWLLQKF